MAPGTPVDRRERKRQITHDAITTAGQHLFSHHGFSSTSVVMIADRADVAEATVYNHFPSKEAIFFENRCPWMQLIRQVLQHDTSDAEGDPDLLGVMVHMVVDLMNAHLERMSAPDSTQTLRSLTHEEPLRRWEAALHRQAEDVLARRVTGHAGLSTYDARRWATLMVAETRVHVEARRRALTTGDAAPLAARQADLKHHLLQLQGHVLGGTVG